MGRLSIMALEGVPLVEKGADLAELVLNALATSGTMLQLGDIIVLAQKIVSKAEGRQFALSAITPSARAIELAKRCEKDPRLVELVLSEAEEVMRVRPGVLIVRHRLGLVLANAGIDRSNVNSADGPAALMLPIDPDASAARLCQELHDRTGTAAAVLIIDSLGRAWRQGTIGTAIGVSGLSALLDLRGQEDLYGRRLEGTDLGIADELAAAASLVMGQAGEGTPIAVIRDLALSGEGTAADLIRPRALDLFP